MAAVGLLWDYSYTFCTMSHPQKKSLDFQSPSTPAHLKCSQSWCAHGKHWWKTEVGKLHQYSTNNVYNQVCPFQIFHKVLLHIIISDWTINNLVHCAMCKILQTNYRWVVMFFIYTSGCTSCSLEQALLYLPGQAMAAGVFLFCICFLQLCFFFFHL